MKWMISHCTSAFMAVLMPMVAFAQIYIPNPGVDPAPTLPVVGPLSYQVIPNQPYSSIDPVNNVMDIYLPVDDGTKLRPVVFMFHGGCFTGGTKDEMNAEAIALVQEGVVVVNVEYRKSPNAPYPAAWMDAMTAARQVIANAATYNIDPARKASFGHSAGSTLAAYLVLKPLFTTAWTQDSLSSSMRVAFSAHGRMDFENRDPALDPSIPDCAENFLNMRRTTDTMKYFTAASPLNMVNQWTPKMIFQHNQQDKTVLPYHSQVMSNKLNSMGRSSVLFMEWAGGHYLTPEQKVMARRMLERELGMPY